MQTSGLRQTDVVRANIVVVAQNGAASAGAGRTLVFLGAQRTVIAGRVVRFDRIRTRPGGRVTSAHEMALVLCSTHDGVIAFANPKLTCVALGAEAVVVADRSVYHGHRNAGVVRFVARTHVALIGENGAIAGGAVHALPVVASFPHGAIGPVVADVTLLRRRVLEADGRIVAGRIADASIALVVLPGAVHDGTLHAVARVAVIVFGAAVGVGVAQLPFEGTRIADALIVGFVADAFRALRVKG